MTTPKRIGTSSIEVHKGATIMRFASEYYKLSQAIKEMVQNMLDNGASIIVVEINLLVRTLVVLGNGLGSSEAHFEKALSNVCNSIKGGVKSRKYGRFGIGLFSPVDKCKKFTFTANNPHNGETIMWVFEKDKFKEKHDFAIPKFEANDLPDSFRVRCSMEQIIPDRSRTKIDLMSLAAAISTEYSVGLKENDAVVILKFTDEEGNEHELEVRYEDFKGEEIDPVEYSADEENSAEFYLYISPLEDSKRRGVVTVSIKDNPFRLKFADVFSKADNGLISHSALKALKSGAFNGEIISRGCELLESRTGLRKNDSFSSLCQIINTWWEEVGEEIYKDIKVEEETNRLQDLGRKALEDLARLLSDPNFRDFRDIVEQFRIGRITHEHAGLPKAVVKGKQDVPSLSPGVPEDKEKKNSKKSKGRGGSSDSDENPGHLPLSVTGSRGSCRTEVYDNSLGIQISHSEMPGDMRMYGFDFIAGVLEINILHPNWVALEGSDSALVEYQTHCLFTALVSAGNPDKDSGEMYENFAKPLLQLVAGRLRLSI